MTKPIPGPESRDPTIRNRGASALAWSSLGLIWVLFIAWSCYHFTGAGHDDIFIFLWSGETLGSAPWLVNFNYHPEEMVSSLLVPLIVAAIHALAPAGTFILTKWAGLLAASSVMFVLWRGRALLFGDRLSASGALFAIAATASSPLYQYWSLGGMETTYQAVLFTLLPLALAGHVRHSSAGRGAALLATLTLLVLVRAEGFWILIPGVLFLGLYRLGTKWDIRDTVIAAVPPLLWLSLTAWRWRATGSPWPNPVLAKVGSFDLAIPLGWSYLRGYYASQVLPALQLAALLAGSVLLARHLFLRLQKREDGLMPPAMAVAVAIALLQDLFVLAVGGNWMPYYRFLVPTIPLKNAVVAWVAGLLITRLGDFARWPAVSRRLVAAGAAALALAVCLGQQFTRDINHLNPEIGNFSLTLPRDFFRGTLSDINLRAVALTSFHQEDLAETLPFIQGPLLNLVQQYGRVTVLSGHAGLFPYLLRRSFEPSRVWFLDIFGLADQEIARLDVPKNHWGNVFSQSVLAIYAGKARDAFTHLADPQLYYVRVASPAILDFFRELGFRLVWERPHSYIFFREGLTSPRE